MKPRAKSSKGNGRRESISLVTPSRILATEEAHDCYDLLCGRRKADYEVKKGRRELIGEKQVFDDTVQAFYVAATVGHLLQRGNRPHIEGKASELILRQHWDRQEKRDIQQAFTYLAKLEYDASSSDDVLQIVAELAEVGIKYIKGKVVDTGDFDFKAMLDPLRKMTKEKGKFDE